MKTLYLNFNNSERKKSTLSPKIVKQDLESKEVRDVMEAICALDIFEKDDTQLYVSPHSAYYREVIITDLV